MFHILQLLLCLSSLTTFFIYLYVYIAIHAILRHYLVNEKFKDFLLTALDLGSCCCYIYCNAALYIFRFHVRICTHQTFFWRLPIIVIILHDTLCSSMFKNKTILNKQVQKLQYKINTETNVLARNFFISR